jgi:hypothetical protein
VVDSHNIDRGVILGRGRHDDFFGSCFDVSLGLLLAEVNTCALGNIVGARGSPLDLAGIFLFEDLDGLAIDLDSSFDSLDITLEATYTSL